MRRINVILILFGLLGAGVGGAASATAQSSAPSATGRAAELTGLWHSTKRFGPDERGPIVLERNTNGWTAAFLGRWIAVRQLGNTLDFTLPGDRGSFRALLARNGSIASAQWFQPRSMVDPPFATPVYFAPAGKHRWRGEVRPVDSSFTLYLMVERRSDGTVSAFIRNPDRNIGHNLNVEQLTRAGDIIELRGKRNGVGAETVLVSGTYDAPNETLRLILPNRGGSYDLHRADEHSDFWPRGREPERYVYRPPAPRGDGWPVGSVDEVDIDRTAIERFVQMILDMPMDSVKAHEVHGVLIARRGRLVVEEYFHGHHADRLHDTRSASKSLTATLVGAALHAGVPLTLSDRVYQVMNGGNFPPRLEPRKQAMTLEHLLTMTSGIFCDDGNPEAPGREDRMLDEAEDPDFYRYYMAMPMDRYPGERAIYCSGDPNLAIGVLAKASGEHPMDLFERVLAKPLQIDRHAWYLSPSLQPYGGGSVQILPRDFLKLGQLMLDGGNWNGRRLLDRKFVERAQSNLCALNKVGYGYLWWTTNFPYKDRQVRAYWAGGNGGQGVIVVPELELVIATFGGSYIAREGLEIQQGYAPRYILPAVRKGGDRIGGPVKPQDYQLLYGRQRPAPTCAAFAADS